MTDEQVRALIAAKLWAAGTATVRKANGVETHLATADRLLIASYDMGSPIAETREDQITVLPDQYSALRLAEWPSRQSPDAQQWFRSVLTTT